VALRAGDLGVDGFYSLERCTNEGSSTARGSVSGWVQCREGSQDSRVDGHLLSRDIEHSTHH
jgi:hypothetical protein